MIAHNPLIQIVDENDEPIGSASKKEAQEQGLLHRIVQIMVEDPDGRVLLQKRAINAELHPDRWDTSVGGHVDGGEDYLSAAVREMFEEIGIKDVELQDLGKYRKNKMLGRRHLNRFYKVFKAIVPVNTQFNIEPTELSEVRWFTLDEVKQLIKQPGQVTGGIIEVINRFYS